MAKQKMPNAMTYIVWDPPINVGTEVGPQINDIGDQQ
jgi:hypothetical protein